jgi:hypothetical protein
MSNSHSHRQLFLRDRPQATIRTLVPYAQAEVDLRFASLRSQTYSARNTSTLSIYPYSKINLYENRTFSKSQFHLGFKLMQLMPPDDGSGRQWIPFDAFAPVSKRLR